jgi:uncharacterized protein
MSQQASMEFPRRIPLFPLPNVVLFPGVPLPLHVFEPRYREMVRDAEAGDAVIGIILLKGDWQRDYYGTPSIFGTGCAGRMVSVEGLPDGSSNILLHGIREFSIVREASTRSYREAEITWRPGAAVCSVGGDVRRRIIHLIEQFSTHGNETPARKLLHDDSLSDELLINFFSYALDISPLEKQGLLETESLVERANGLANVLEFRLEEIRLSGKNRAGSDRWH